MYSFQKELLECLFNFKYNFNLSLLIYIFFTILKNKLKIHKGDLFSSKSKKKNNNIFIEVKFYLFLKKKIYIVSWGKYSII